MVTNKGRVAFENVAAGLAPSRFQEETLMTGPPYPSDPLENCAADIDEEIPVADRNAVVDVHVVGGGCDAAAAAKSTMIVRVEAPCLCRRPSAWT